VGVEEWEMRSGSGGVGVEERGVRSGRGGGGGGEREGRREGCGERVERWAVMGRG